MSTLTPVAALQEFTVAQCLSPPKYEVVAQVIGTHKPQFEFTVSVAGIEATGCASSKQAAKHQAAKNALLEIEKEGKHSNVTLFLEGLNLPVSCNDEAPDSDSIAELQNICTEKVLPMPDYFETVSGGLPHCRIFTYGCSVGSVIVEAQAGSKKLAKRLAAKEMLDKLKSMSDLDLQNNSDLYVKLKTLNIDAKEKYLQLSNKMHIDETFFTDFSNNPIAKIMTAKGLRYEDFSEDLKTQTEESFRRITDKLGVTYMLRQSQKKPTMALLTVAVQMPFAQIAVGETFEEAKQKVLNQSFLVLESYMGEFF